MDALARAGGHGYPPMMDAALACLACRVGDRRVALPAADVLRVLPLGAIWRPPALPAPLAGFMLDGGAAVPVIALAALLEGGAAPASVDIYAHLVLLRALAGGPAALLVDRVEGLVTAEAVRPVAEGASVNGAVAGEIAVADGVAHLIATDRLLLAEEGMRLAALREAAAARAATWAA